jgi:hypothetical protein
VGVLYSTMTVTSTSPATGPQGLRGLVVQVNGTTFAAGATVAFSGAGITVTGVTWVSATRVDATIDIAGAAALGARNVTVTNPNADTATGTGVFTVGAPTISVSLSTRGYTDVARDTTSPWAMNFGTLAPGTTRQIGPGGSGQTLAGAAVIVTITGDTTTDLQVQSTSWSGGGTMPVSALEYRHSSTAEAWTPMSTSASTTDTLIPSGTPTRSFDYQLTVPGGQATGAYTATVTYTAIATP